MAKEKIEDRRSELAGAFSAVFQQWLAPDQHPHVRWGDVEDARQDVIQHVNALAKNEQLTPAQPVQGREQP